MSEREFSDEELQALEAEMERVTVDDVLLQTIVTLINVGARKAGLAGAGGTGSVPPPPDLDQLREAIEGARAILPLVEQRHADKLGPVRDSLSRLQMFYAQSSGGRVGGAESSPAAQQEDEPEAPNPGEPGPAQRSGRLWVPGD